MRLETLEERGSGQDQKEQQIQGPYKHHEREREGGGEIEIGQRLCVCAFSR